MVWDEYEWFLVFFLSSWFLPLLLEPAPWRVLKQALKNDIYIYSIISIWIEWSHPYCVYVFIVYDWRLPARYVRVNSHLKYFDAIQSCTFFPYFIFFCCITLLKFPDHHCFCVSIRLIRYDCTQLHYFWEIIHLFFNNDPFYIKPRVPTLWPWDMVMVPFNAKKAVPFNTHLSGIHNRRHRRKAIIMKPSYLFTIDIQFFSSCVGVQNQSKLEPSM